MCPDCKQEIAHTCPLLSHSVIMSSNQEQPLELVSSHSDAQVQPGSTHTPSIPSVVISSSYTSPISNVSGNQTGLGPSDTGNIFGECVMAQSTQPAQHHRVNDHSVLGKRGPSRTDFGSESEGRSASSSTQQSDDQCLSQCSAISNLLPSLDAASNSEISARVSSGPETQADLTYNEFEREPDVNLIHSWDVDPQILFLKFSKDGKYLAVGFWQNGKIDIYDVQTGKKTWLGFGFSSFLDMLINLS